MPIWDESADGQKTRSADPTFHDRQLAKNRAAAAERRKVLRDAVNKTESASVASTKKTPPSVNENWRAERLHTLRTLHRARHGQGGTTMPTETCTENKSAKPTGLVPIESSAPPVAISCLVGSESMNLIDESAKQLSEAIKTSRDVSEKALAAAALEKLLRLKFDIRRTR